jgi:hypothetical protein
MQLQAPFRSDIQISKPAPRPTYQCTSVKSSPSLRSGFPASAIFMAAVCLSAATAGCGSGLVGPSTPQATMTTPVASAKGPQLGYLWVNSDKTLRPILGVAGASQVGQSVVPAGVYIGATASATASIAVLQDTTGAFDLMSLPSGSPVSLNLTLPAGARIRLSPGAAAALLYTPGASSASLVTGLLSTPAIHTIAAPSAIADSAVSDTGTVSFESAQGSSFAVSVMPLGGLSTPLASVKSTGGLNFLPGRDDLLFADAAANSLTLIRSTTTAPSASLVQTAQLLQTPLAVGVSGSGRWAIVVNSAATSGSQNLVRIDLTTLTSTSVACSCTPTLAATLADDGAFRVTDAVTGPNWIVDAAATTPRVLFIPALPTPVKTSLVASVVP